MTPGSIPGMGTHIFFFFSFFSFSSLSFLSLFYFFFFLLFFPPSKGNYQSPLNRAFEGGFNGDAADSTEFCVVNCIANRSAKSFSSEKINIQEAK